MDNMRRMLPAPSLRMSEGGMFNSLKRAVGMGPPETIQQKFAREDAALKAKMAASAPPAPAPAPPPKAVSGYVGNSALEGRMKAAGLRNGGDLSTGHGGHVPGKGKGDKIPAKYEPGEFVVSNDMLDAAPELRGQLSSLRGQVLAQKGMTPEQADAKALSGTGLRAQGGFSDEWAKPQPWNSGTPGGPSSPIGKPNSFGDAASNAQTKVPPKGTSPNWAKPGQAWNSGQPGGPSSPVGGGTDRSSWNKAQPWNSGTPGGASSNISGKTFPNQSSGAAERNPHVKSGGFSEQGKEFKASGATKPATMTGTEPPKGPGTVRTAAKAALPTVLAGIGGGYIADKMRNIGNPDNQPAVPPKPKTADDLRIDAMVAQIPGGGYTPDSDAGPAEPYNFFRDNETGRNVGNTMNALSMIPVVGGAGAALRASTVAGTTRAAQAIPLAAAAVGGAAKSVRDGRTPGGNYGNEGRNNRAPSDELAGPPESAKAPANVQGADGRTYLPETVSNADLQQSEKLVEQAFSRNTKTGGEFNMNDGINTLRSSPGDMALANKAWAMRGAGVQASYDSKGGLVLSGSTAPEKMQYTSRDGKPTSRYEDTEQFDNGQRQLASARASLRNPDGSTWSADDNAVMAANLRDGVDPYRGTSRGQQTASAPASNVYGSPGFSNGRSRRADRDLDVVQSSALRKDGTERRGQDMLFAGKQAEIESASRSSLRAAQIAERTAQIAERTFQTGRADRAEDQEAKVFERAQTARKNFTDRANTMFPGKDGKPDAEKVAEYTSFVSRSTAGVAQKLMQSKDPVKQAAGKRLANGDMSGLDATDIKTIDEQFEIDQLTKDRSGRSTAAGSSQPVGIRNGMLRDYVKLADGSEVPKSALTGAGWFDDGDPRLLNSLNKGN